MAVKTPAPEHESRMNRRLKLLIFEPSPVGHRMALYLRNIIREVARRRWGVHLVTTDSARDHPAYSLLAEEHRDFTASTVPAVEFSSMKPSTVNLLRCQAQHFRAFARAYRAARCEVKPDVIYVNDLGYCDKAMAMLGSPFGKTPFVGTLMQAKFHHRSMDALGPGSRNDWLNEKLFARLLRVSTLGKVLVNDPLLIPYMKRKLREGGDKIQYLPDIAYLSGDMSKEQARRTLGIQGRDIVVLMYGALDARKGIKELLAALRHLGPASNVVALVVGEPQDSATRQLLAGSEVVELTKRGMLQVITGFVDDEQEFTVFRAADFVWLGYQGFYGMSGVLLQAGLAGLPVMACKQGLIGWLARRHALGEILETMEPAEIGSSILRLGNDFQARRACGDRGRKLAMTHTPQRVAEAVCDALASAINH